MGPLRRCGLDALLAAATACGNPSGPPGASRHHDRHHPPGSHQHLVAAGHPAAAHDHHQHDAGAAGDGPPSGPRTETGTTTSGGTTISVTVGPLDQGPGQPVTITVALTTSEFALVTIHMGDGTAEPVRSVGAECPPGPTAVPLATHQHIFAAAGPYVIRAVATLYPCTPGSGALLPNIGLAPRTVEAAVNYQQR